MGLVAAKIEPTAKEEIVNGLTQSLAETAITTLKAQNFHWNVTGMAFGELHRLFQEIYEDHFQAQDDLAERIRALNEHAEGKLAGMLERSKVEEHDGHQSDREMVEILMKAQETIAATLGGLGELAANHGDTLTEDLAIERGRTHEKFAWMLRAHIA